MSKKTWGASNRIVLLQLLLQTLQSDYSKIGEEEKGEEEENPILSTEMNL